MANIVLASMYRSGSNHIADSLASLLGGKRTYLNKPGEGYAQDPQRLDFIAASVLFNRLSGMVYLQHILGTQANLGVLKYYEVPTIVTMRKLRSALHSLRRYEEALVDDDRKDNKYINSNWSSSTDEQKWKWVAYNTIPWYYQFYVSWMTADLPRLIVWYEEHFENQIASARTMLKFIKADDFSDDQIEAAFNHRNSNYTQNRTVYPMPPFVMDIARDQARAWGLWEEAIVRDLLDD